MVDRLCYQHTYTPPPKRTSDTYYLRDSPPTTPGWARLSTLEHHVLQLIRVSKDERAEEVREEMYKHRRFADTLRRRIRLLHLDNEQFRQKFAEQGRELKRTKAVLSWTRTQKRALARDLQHCKDELARVNGTDHVE